MPRQLKGTLQDLHTTQLFHLINLTKKTGTLHLYDGVPTGREIIMGDGETKRPEVTTGKERARIAFKEGKLIHALSGDQDGHLALVLYEAGKLSEEQFRVIRQKAATYSDRALALLLINANYVSQAEVVQSVRQRVLRIVYDIGTWKTEPFVFEEGEQPTNDRITVPIDLGEVIRSITSRIEPDHNDLPNLDFRLKFPDSAPTEKLRGAKLSREEWFVIRYVTGQNSIRQIAKACNMTETEIRRVVSGLLNSGLVELVKPAAPPTSTTRSRSSLSRQAQPTASTPGSGPLPIQKTDKSTVMRLIDHFKSMS